MFYKCCGVSVDVSSACANLQSAINGYMSTDERYSNKHLLHIIMAPGYYPASNNSKLNLWGINVIIEGSQSQEQQQQHKQQIQQQQVTQQSITIDLQSIAGFIYLEELMFVSDTNITLLNLVVTNAYHENAGSIINTYSNETSMVTLLSWLPTQTLHSFPIRCCPLSMVHCENTGSLGTNMNIDGIDSLLIENSVFSDTKGLLYGNAIYLFDVSTALLQDNTFTNNGVAQTRSLFNN
ncbi:hypothetical protein PPL_06380 [Heterostelium album PN500]|uniref:Right handed beta helix domain-containing protein n=1 Tax=Heterostelium pallidum (strain ATCC 26659 / Pp 5 / PN500) TaxID=670386 RepID=D3BD02_HETP5|nr:hypothetical protein PPL_06380 [Heterostelium album PN500]EFA80794.1 hypothetical protein PPL_06380 [Heterostelium album PN500]|eukprot:XP_020432913.1 hypothetical protein PPL_06380 [Heterostelium album PN500]